MTYVSEAKQIGPNFPAAVFNGSAVQSPTLALINAKREEVGAAHPVARSAHEMAARHGFSDLEVNITDEDRAFWAFMKPQERPSFTPQLLSDLAGMQTLINEMFKDGNKPFDYFVLGSRSQGVFNLGGDLPLFLKKIRERDREGLLRYAYACTRTGYANYSGYNHGVVTIALFQGDAMGGGLESALSCDVLIAERQAKFGLPEVLFNLFPGMGAYSFLSRRIGQVKAEEVILGGRTYTADEMKEMGAIDIVVDEGEGEQAVKEYIAKNRSKAKSLSSVYKARRCVNPVTLKELYDVNEIWVDNALALSEQDLRRMSKIAGAQDRMRARQRSAAMASFA